MSHRKSRARSKPSLQVRIWGDWDLCWRRLLDRSRVQNSSRGKCWTNLRKQLNQSVPFPRSATLSGLDASYYQYYCYVPELKSLSNEFNLTMRRSVMSFLGTTRENIDILSLDISRLTAVKKEATMNRHSEKLFWNWGYQRTCNFCCEACCSFLYATYSL